MATITARMTARKGLSSAIPQLLPGELGLATDIQKTFIGQVPVAGSCDITNSTTTTAIVEFMTSSGYPIDLDEITTSDLLYGITVTDSVTNVVTDIPGANIVFSDQKATFTHPLKDADTVTIRVPVSADIFSLWYNKEVGYVAEAFVNPTQTLTFTATASSVAQATGVEFLCENKESVTIDYTLSTSSASRRGTLTMLLDNASGVPSTSSIKDEFDISSGTIPVEFSLTDNGTDKFILNFKTTDTVNAHTFTYIQKSFK
jgi:hypothetical protein